MKKVFLDAGHGGMDSGAVGNGLQEKDINLLVALKVGKILTRHNIEVNYTRTTDIAVGLSDRATIANKNGSDVFASIHCNSFYDVQSQGLETFSYNVSANGTALAKCIQDSLLKDKLYTKDRGIKTANFAVLRQTKMTSALVELAFISNKKDSEILRNKQDELAISVAKGILNFLGAKYVESNHFKETGTNILGSATATIEQMKAWAKNKNAHQKFIELAPLFYEISEKAGVNPIIAYTQSAKETGYFKFGGVLDITFNNPCGMKVSVGGGDYDPNAHKRFEDWAEGIQAQVDHLALYGGAPSYPKTDTLDPRHFSYLKGSAKTVEDLGGKWAPSLIYGTDIVKMMREVESIKVEEKEEKINTDIPSSWAKEDWDWGIKNKITDGSNPKRIATREEVISMIRSSKEVK